MRQSAALNDEPRLVSIASPRTQEDAEKIASLLAQAGIHSSIRGVAPPLEVLVRESDADAADRLLNRMYGVEGAEDEPAEAGRAAAIPRCPECASDQVEKVFTLAHFATFALLLYGVGLAIEHTELALMLIGVLAVALFVANRRRCLSCGARWRGTD